MIRLRTSRPMWSVPRMNSELPRVSHAGGRYRRRKLPTSGLCGAGTSANTAVHTSKIKIPNEMSGSPRSLAALRRDRESTAGCAVNVSVGVMTGLLSIANPRINVGVENVHDQVDTNNRQASHEYSGLHDWKIPERDAFIGQPANPGPGEDGFDHQGALNNQGKLNRGKGQHRNHGVLEGMLEDHQPF